MLSQSVQSLLAIQRRTPRQGETERTEREGAMKNWMILPIGLGLLFAVNSVQSGTVAKASTGERGRYEGVVASDNAVWVVDTRTGKVRRCTQEFADQTPKCSDYSR